MNKPSKKIIGILILVGVTVIYFLPPTDALSREAMRASALVLFAIGFWATGVLAEHLTALLFLLLATVSKVAPAQVVFSGFYSSAIWLVFGGMVLAATVKSTGLGRRMAHVLLSYLGSSYLWVITGVVLLGVLFSFFIPSTMGRVVLLTPVTMAVAERLRFEKGSPGYDGLIMASVLACFVPSCSVLPANVPNMVAAGAAETLYNISFKYGEYLKVQFPVIGALNTIAIIIITRALFPARILSASSDHPRPKEPFSSRDRTLTIILSMTLLLWGTDFIHGISPAWIALAAAIVCLLPFTGFFSNGDLTKINLAPFFYVAGVLGMGAVVAKTGLGNVLGRELISLFGFQPGHDAHNFFGLAVLSVALGPVTTAPGVPAVLSPLSADLAAATGFPLVSVLMTQVIGFSTVIFPYQSPPIMVGMQLGGVRWSSGLRLTLTLAAVSLLILTPINFLWWACLGMFG
jgi:anion transporter